MSFSIRSATCAIPFALLCALPPLGASVLNRASTLVTSEPLLAGSAVLSPGSYTVKLIEPPFSSHIVQIFNSGGHLETTILSISAERPAGDTGSEFRFYETPKGVPKAMKDWFYPGDSYGEEFPFPKKLVAAYLQQHPQAPPALELIPRVPAGTVEPAKEIAPVLRRASQVHQPALRSSYAVVSEPPPSAMLAVAPPALPAAKPGKAHTSGAWIDWRHLPLTATLGPLIGLIGLLALGSSWLTAARRS